MKKLLLFIILLCSGSVNAQPSHIYIVKDTTSMQKNIHEPSLFGPKIKPVKAVLLSNGVVVWEGEKLTLGKGSLPNGDYNYIATASNTMEAKLKRTTSLKEIQVLYILKKGNKKYGYVYVFQAEGPRDGYLIQLEDAVNAGEIVFP